MSRADEQYTYDYGTGEIKKIEKEYIKMNRNIKNAVKNELVGDLTPANRNKLKELIEQLPVGYRHHLRYLASRGHIGGNIVLNVVSAGLTELDIVTDAMKHIIKEINPEITIEQIEAILDYSWSGIAYNDRIYERMIITTNKFHQSISKGMLTGIDYKKIAKEVDDVSRIGLNNATTLVRTELNYVMNQATLKNYEKLDIEYYEYLAELDKRTSQICEDMNGRIFKLKDAVVGVNYPPLHPSCRSTTVPVIKESQDD